MYNMTIFIEQADAEILADLRELINKGASEELTASFW